ncbi:MAG: DUF1844 domain-containing protein [Deltaproteobacteria bacterium]|nr:DUF1844 domain-containing protein [Deltaproteobacteria bacterium]
MEEGKKGFVVKDRRGSERDDNAKIAEGGKATDTLSNGEGEGVTASSDSALEEVNFSSFIISLSTTAMLHFGLFPDPETKQATQNLPAAKQVIDIIALLQKKTEGNLTTEEASLIKDALYNLRMSYIQLTKQ